MSSNEAYEYRIKSSEKNIEIAKDMYKLGHYDWSLFLWHLALEKILKAQISLKDKEIPLYGLRTARTFTHG
ncbi:MAG: HEPN domain-containing protein [Patescibacteria group bacterium]